MFDTAQLMEAYDASMAEFGQPALSFAHFDRRVLIPRSIVPRVVEDETRQHLHLDAIDAMDAAGLITWLGGAGKDGTELGVPLYVPARIGLMASLEQKGWTRIELQDYCCWEEALVDDCLMNDNSAYEQDDRRVVAAQLHRDLEQVNAEIWGRMPVEEQPEGWVRHGWNSTLEKLSTDQLESKRAEIMAFLDKVERTDLATSPPRWVQRLARTAFAVRFRDEGIVSLLVGADRTKLATGFSPAIWLTGEQALTPDPAKLEDFGCVDWRQTFADWRFLNDPDHFPLRLPGFVLVGGRITMDALPSPADFEKRRDLFELDEYLRLFPIVAGSRRCAHCGKLLPVSASNRRRYCSRNCSQAARQKSYRYRQKASIVRNRRAGR